MVREIITSLHKIVPSGNNTIERLEVEQIKKEIDARMMEYLSLFTQMKMGQVPEQVKLKLSALRHDAKFSNLTRKKKLDIRVNKNVEYFKKTDITGILEGYRKSITHEGWEKIKEQKPDWVCMFSQDDIYEMMRKSADNVMCLGILVKRDEKAIDSPTQGLELISISNTVISYDAFIAAMVHTKNENDNNNNPYGDISGLNESYCIVGGMREKINAVIPLYINFEHMKRIRILEGIWLGYLFTLDSYGYDKKQEVGLVKLVHDIIKKTAIINSAEKPTQRSKQLIIELEKVCQFIISESVGFKTEISDTIYNNYMTNIQSRNLAVVEDLEVMMMIAYLRDDLKKIAVPIYYEHLKRALKKRFPKGDPNLTDIIKRVMYGDGLSTVSTLVNSLTINLDDPDYVEKSFIDYFYDEMKKPIQLVPEKGTVVTRSAIIEPDEPYIHNTFLKDNPVPSSFKYLLVYAGINENLVETLLNYDSLRKEILLILKYENIPPSHIDHSNILKIIDEEIQGSPDQTTLIDNNPENIAVITFKALECKTLEGFAGLLRKYCPNRYGPIFLSIVKGLVQQGLNVNNNNTSPPNAAEKLISLLTNKINNTVFYKYNGLETYCWQPLSDVIENIRKIVGLSTLQRIEQENLGKRVVHCYRLSNLPNRHRNSNFHPNMNLRLTFSGYFQPK
jgi:hypothetical protein